MTKNNFDSFGTLNKKTKVQELILKIRLSYSGVRKKGKNLDDFQSKSNSLYRNKIRSPFQ